MKNPHVGDVVTVTSRCEAYGSNYGGSRECFMEPGEIGVVGAVKVPKVYLTPGGHYFCCIDFRKYGRRWRTSANYDEIELVRKGGAT